jgi:hypothetical protein
VRRVRPDEYAEAAEANASAWQPLGSPDDPYLVLPPAAGGPPHIAPNDQHRERVVRDRLRRGTPTRPDLRPVPPTRIDEPNEAALTVERLRGRPSPARQVSYRERRKQMLLALFQPVRRPLGPVCRRDRRLLRPPLTGSRATSTSTRQTPSRTANAPPLPLRLNRGADVKAPGH